ncbi:hypothetical protein [Variovorax sp. KK3]|uniref:hypothetical protein n=1 Tax=Variovorax sp. KK3 TaxID=1855728 RepID=UPI00117F0AC3|nr:hypothetical protein [Variovorax sp. KK3]
MFPSLESFTRRIKTGVKQSVDSLRKSDQKPSGAEAPSNRPYPPSTTKAKWPEHLIALFNDLSTGYRSGNELFVVIDLVHAIGLTEAACKELLDSGGLQELIVKIQSRAVVFKDGELKGFAPYLALLLQRIVLTDTRAARRFFCLLSPEVAAELTKSHAYECMQACLRAKGSAEDLEAKPEAARFLRQVEKILDSGISACARDLELFVRGCPPRARDELILLLERNESVVRAACDQSPTLDEAIEKLTAFWEPLDVKLTLSIGRINLALHDAEPHAAKMLQETQGKENEEARREGREPRLRGLGLQFLDIEPIPLLIREAADSFGQRPDALRHLITKLCRGKATSQEQAKFVSGLLVELRRRESSEKKPFDMQRAISDALMSGMPGPAVKWVATALHHQGSSDDAERLVSALEAMLEYPGMKLPQLMALQQLAEVARSDIDNSVRIDLRESLCSRLEMLQKTARDRVAPPSFDEAFELRKDRERDIERVRAAQARKDRTPVELSSAAQGAIELMSADIPVMEKIYEAKPIFNRMNSQQSIRDVVVELGGRHLVSEFFGLLVGSMMVYGTPQQVAMALEVLLERGSNEADRGKLAKGLVSAWYAVKQELGLGPSQSTKGLIDALNELQKTGDKTGGKTVDEMHNHQDFYKHCRSQILLATTGHDHKESAKISEVLKTLGQG